MQSAPIGRGACIWKPGSLEAWKSTAKGSEYQLLRSRVSGEEIRGNTLEIMEELGKGRKNSGMGVRFSVLFRS